MKKKLSILLAVSLLTFVLPQLSFATDKYDFGYEKTLVETEVMNVIDEDGNSIEIIVEEYLEIPTDNSNDIISTRGFIKEYPVGSSKTWVFYISNTTIGIPSFVAGTPISSAAKKALASAITRKLGEKIGSALVPGLNIASWVAAGIAMGNTYYGNEGFTATVKSTYESYYSHKEGYYLYGWNLLESLKLGTY